MGRQRESRHLGDGVADVDLVAGLDLHRGDVAGRGHADDLVAREAGEAAGEEAKRHESDKTMTKPGGIYFQPRSNSLSIDRLLRQLKPHIFSSSAESQAT